MLHHLDTVTGAPEQNSMHRLATGSPLSISLRPHPLVFVVRAATRWAVDSAGRPALRLSPGAQDLSTSTPAPPAFSTLHTSSIPGAHPTFSPTPLPPGGTRPWPHFMISPGTPFPTLPTVAMLTLAFQSGGLRCLRRTPQPSLHSIPLSSLQQHTSSLGESMREISLSSWLTLHSTQ